MLNRDLEDKMGAQMRYPEELTKETFKMKMTYFSVQLRTNQTKLWKDALWRTTFQTITYW